MITTTNSGRRPEEQLIAEGCKRLFENAIIGDTKIRYDIELVASLQTKIIEPTKQKAKEPEKR